MRFFVCSQTHVNRAFVSGTSEMDNVLHTSGSRVSIHTGESLTGIGNDGRAGRDHVA